jgi:hypothetical protein
MHRAWRPFRTVPPACGPGQVTTPRGRSFALHPENITLVLYTHLIGLESSALVLASPVLKHCSSRSTCPNSGWPAGSHAGHGGRHRSRVRGDAPVAFVPSETRSRPPIERRTRLLNHLACAAPQPCNAVHPVQYWLTRLQPPVVASMLAGAVLLPLALPDSNSSIPGWPQVDRAGIRASALQRAPGGTYRGTLQGLANVCLFCRMRYETFLIMAY